jgi:hypothetical protein
MAIFLQTLSVMIAALTVAFGVQAWRRQLIGGKRAEVAEKALTMMYEAQDILDSARSPASFGNEGKSRIPEDGETEAQTSHRNALYVPAERLVRQREFFMALNASRYRFAAYFGRDATIPFTTIFKARNRVLISARMLVSARDRNMRTEDIALRQRWENDIWTVGGDGDEIKRDVDQAVEQVEALCRPALTEKPEMFGIHWIAKAAAWLRANWNA